MNTILFARAATKVALVTGILAATATVSYAAPTAVTFNPGAFASGAPAFTADKLNLLDFARVDVSGSNFTETGFLQVNNVSLNNDTFNPTGNRATYSLYFAFTGTGVQSAPTFNQSSVGTFNTLTYTLYGANGATAFGIDGSNNPFATDAGSRTALATGSLIDGTTSFSAAPLGAAANIDATFVQQLAGFITSPANATLRLAGAFNNDSNIVTRINGGTGFTLNGGGGDITFTSTPNPVPEPATLAILGTGLLGFGLARRRRG